MLGSSEFFCFVVVVVVVVVAMPHLGISTVLIIFIKIYIIQN